MTWDLKAVRTVTKNVSSAQGTPTKGVWKHGLTENFEI